jgi:hypothetical protein
MVDHVDVEQVAIRSGTTAAWAAAGAPILGSGELGIDIDTGDVRIGDGVNVFAALELVGKDGVDVNAIPWVEYTFYSDADLSSTHQYNPLTNVNAFAEIDSRTPDGEVSPIAIPGATQTIRFQEPGLYAVSTTVDIQAGATATDPALGAAKWTTTGTEGNAQNGPVVPYAIRDAPSGAHAAIVLPTVIFPVLSAGTHAYDVSVLCDSGGDGNALAFAAYISIVKITAA